ncbi:MAG: DUF3794 domain-containing protein [Hespellia sp.]|nr:DUF3794 domain-containing protein [Hespellia sp.]
MELRRQQIHCSKLGKRILDQFYLDEDYNVPDAKEDVKSVIQSEGYLKIEDMRLVENYIRLTGKFYFHILYATAESEPQLEVLEGLIPVEEMIYAEETKEDEFYLKEMRIDMSATLIHSRKIAIRAMIEAEIAREAIRDEETVTDMEDESPVYKKNKLIHLLEMRMNKGDVFRIKEEIEVPGTKENIGRLLWASVKPRKIETKLASDELRISGELLVFILYESEEGKDDWAECNVPFEGRIDCSGASEELFYHVQSRLEDVDVEPRLDSDGEMRALGIEGTLKLHISIYGEEELELLEDAYSLRQQCCLDTREAVYEELLLQNQSRCKIAQQLALPELPKDILQICHSSASIQVEQQTVTEEGVNIEGILHVSILYVRADDAMPYASWSGMVPFSHLIEVRGISENTICELSWHLEQLSVTLSGNEQAEVKAVLGFDAFLRNPVPTQVILSAEMKPLDTALLEKQPGIVGYMVKSGDTMWDLAKRYMTTVEGIQAVNELPDETLKAGDKLLIFKENMSIL